MAREVIAFRPKRFIIEHGHHPGDSDIAPDRQQPYRLRISPNMSMKPADADSLREITVRSKTGQVVPLGRSDIPFMRRCPPWSGPKMARWLLTSTSIWIREPTWRAT